MAHVHTSSHSDAINDIFHIEFLEAFPCATCTPGSNARGPHSFRIGLSRIQEIDTLGIFWIVGSVTAVGGVVAVMAATWPEVEVSLAFLIHGHNVGAFAYVPVEGSYEEDVLAYVPFRQAQHSSST